MTNPRDEGWTGISLNGVGIAMYPAPADIMMQDIARILGTARDGWDAANGRIEGLEGKIGQGPLGEPVAQQYNPAAAQLRKYVAEMVENLTKLSDAGTKAVPIYVDADLEAGHHFKF
jgi:hypothetical protein